jgi:hypothetical protein
LYSLYRESFDLYGTEKAEINTANGRWNSLGDIHLEEDITQGLQKSSTRSLQTQIGALRSLSKLNYPAQNYFFLIG